MEAHGPPPGARATVAKIQNRPVTGSRVEIVYNQSVVGGAAIYTGSITLCK